MYIKGRISRIKNRNNSGPHRNFRPPWNPGLLPLVRGGFTKGAGQPSRKAIPCFESIMQIEREQPCSSCSGAAWLWKIVRDCCASEIRAVVSTRLTFEKMRSSRPWRIFRTSSSEKWIADLSVDRVPRTSRGVDVLIFQNATSWETLQQESSATLSSNIFALLGDAIYVHSLTGTKRQHALKVINKFHFINNERYRNHSCVCILLLSTCVASNMN